jgi:hypothetical protein
MVGLVFSHQGLLLERDERLEQKKFVISVDKEMFEVSMKMLQQQRQRHAPMMSLLPEDQPAI